METKKIELTCIGCPMGCPLIVTMEDGVVASVTGNTCPRGDAYARKEVTAPTRIVTSTVRVTGGTLAMVYLYLLRAAGCREVSVSLSSIADFFFCTETDVVRALKDVEVPAPITIGQVLAENVAGTGVDIIATKNIAHA